MITVKQLLLPTLSAIIFCFCPTINDAHAFNKPINLGLFGIIKDTTNMPHKTHLQDAPLHNHAHVHEEEPLKEENEKKQFQFHSYRIEDIENNHSTI